MKHFLAAVLVSCLLSAPSQADSSDAHNRASLEQMRLLTLEGMHHLYNFDVERADQKFENAIAMGLHHPRPYLSRAMAPLWKFFITRVESDYEEVVRLTTEAIDVAENYLEDNGSDADALTCLGTAYGYRAYAHALNKNYFSAAWDGKKSYDYLSEAVRADTHFYDAYLGLGLVHFAAGTIPKALQWLIAVLGIEGDRDLGIREIELAARKSTYNIPEAKYFLAQFYPWYKGDFEESEKIIDELLHTYPANSVFLYAKGFLKLRQDNVIEALSSFLKMKERSNSYFALITKFAEYRIGECYFRLGEYARARGAYLAFLAVNDKGQFEAVASYHAGLSAEMMGDRLSALPLYFQAKNFDAVHGDDVYAARHAARLLASPLSMVDSLILVARNFHRSGTYRKALDTYTDILHRYTLTNDQRAEVVYKMGECFYDQKKDDEAAQRFRTVLGLKVHSEQWVKPWSHFMLGQIALKKNDTETVRDEFEAVAEYDNYDHKNWLTFRVEQELEKLSK